MKKMQLKVSAALFWLVTCNERNGSVAELLTGRSRVRDQVEALVPFGKAFILITNVLRRGLEAVGPRLHMKSIHIFY